MRRDDAACPDLVAERVLDGLRKRPPGVRERPECAGEDPVELQHAPFVEDDRVEILRLKPACSRHQSMAPDGKARIVLLPREPFFLDGADRYAVDHERRSRIVVMRGDAEDLHLGTGSRPNGTAL